MADEKDINDIDSAIAALEFAAANRGLYLTVHALKRARDVLKWEAAGDREKALKATKGVGTDHEPNARS
jgi:hypothetical protein